MAVGPIHHRGNRYSGATCCWFHVDILLRNSIVSRMIVHSVLTKLRLSLESGAYVATYPFLAAKISAIRSGFSGERGAKYEYSSIGRPLCFAIQSARTGAQ